MSADVSSTAPAAPAGPADVAAVAIGASAGGIDAVERLLAALPACTPFCVLVVLHLPSRRSSRLVEIFAPQCALPVEEPMDKQP
ncbi:hypothetical protein OFC63_31150, partial [Escherichia coli]|nr:hypothetical protein [Escherichia coli]